MEDKEIIHTALDNLDPVLIKGEWRPTTAHLLQQA